MIAALGCSAGLGFVHTGHERSFVYDIADLYKAEVTIPIAFEIAAKASADGCVDIPGETRRAVRDAIAQSNLLERCVLDIRKLLLREDKEAEAEIEISLLQLWDDKLGLIRSGVSYGGESPAQETDDDEETGNGVIVDDRDPS